MFKKTIDFFIHKYRKIPSRDYASARLKMTTLASKKDRNGLLKLVNNLIDQNYYNISIYKYAFSLTKDLDFELATYFAEKLLELEFEPKFVSVYLNRLKANKQTERYNGLFLQLSKYEDDVSNYTNQKKDLIDFYNGDNARALIDRFNQKKIKKEQVRVALARAVFSLIKDDETVLALSFIEPYIEYISDASFLRVIQNRYTAIGEEKKAKVISGLANRKQTVNSFRVGLKNLLEIKDDEFTDIKRYIELCEQNVNDIQSFNKSVFSLLKDELPDLAAQYGLKFYRSASDIDEKFALILALRLSRLGMNYEALDIYRKLYVSNGIEEAKNRALKIVVKIYENRIKTICSTSKKIYSEISSIIPKELLTDNLIVNRIIFEACKNNDDMSDVAIEHANTILNTKKDEYTSLALSNLYFKLGDITSAISVKGLDKRNPKHNLKYTHLKAYRSLLENGFPLPEKNTNNNNNSNILYCLHNSLPYHSGGYATRSHGLAKGISNNGWDIHIASRLGYPYDLSSHKNFDLSRSKVDIVDDLSYHRLFTDINQYGVANLQDYIEHYGRALTELAKELDISIIHGASNFMNGIAANYAARQLGIKSVYEVRGLWEVTRMSRQPNWEGSEHYNMIRRLETEAAMNADAVITITHALKDEMIARGIDGTKITVVSNGVHVNRFVPKPRDLDLEQDLGFKDKVVIGFIGSVVSYEGLEYLVQAVRLLKERGLENFAVMIVGDGAVLDKIKALSKDLNVTDYFTFTGRVPHDIVEDYYSLVDIAPFPRIGVPVCEMVSPLKPFEAMSMGKAVISSDVAALTEIVNDGFTGLTFEKDNAISLADKLQILINEPALRKELGDNARNWVTAEKDWSMLANKVSTIYSNLLETLCDEGVH